VQDAQQRVAPIGPLDKAKSLSNVRAQPYALKTSFTASGGLASDGSWTLEDIAPKGLVTDGPPKNRITRPSISIRSPRPTACMETSPAAFFRFA
jgi:hypothetical protein